MSARAAKPISIDGVLSTLNFLPDRKPNTERDDYFAELSRYRDGAVFAASYAGTTEWERHSGGDEIVLVISGETTLILLDNDSEMHHQLGPNEFLIVPKGVWHRFETPIGVQVVSVTPQPTDHQLERPLSP